MKIVTLTVNPAVDKSTHIDRLIPEQKLRCDAPRFDAGGGGINVSKAIKRLGGKSTAIFTTGGPAGQVLRDLVSQEGIDCEAVSYTHLDVYKRQVAMFPKQPRFRLHSRPSLASRNGIGRW